MLFFRSHIDPFCSFTINLGPLYVERVFDFLLILRGIKNVARASSAERYERYLDYLRGKTALSPRNQYSFIQFYKGHFYQQLANQVESPETAWHIREKALCAFQEYLELAGRLDESRYYAQWQAGVLQHILKYPWPAVEAALVCACALDPTRGEALKRMTDHYIRQKEWKMAYSFSSAAVQIFFGKNPADRRTWFVDSNAYNWLVLNTHLTVCYKLGFLDEAKRMYIRLHTYKLDHLEEFAEVDIRHIHFLQKVLYSPKRLPASSY